MAFRRRCKWDTFRVLDSAAWQMAVPYRPERPREPPASARQVPVTCRDAATALLAGNSSIAGDATAIWRAAGYPVLHRRQGTEGDAGRRDDE
jgi:hypothetical protein